MFCQHLTPTTLVLFSAVALAQAQLIYWDFGSDTGQTTPSDNTSPFVFATALTYGNNNSTLDFLTTTSASTQYPEASGQFNAGLNARPGALNTNLNGSAYFELTLTPAPNYTLIVTNISLGLRSTATGPQAFCIRSSLDNFATDLSTAALAPDGKWSFKNQLLAIASNEPGQPVTLRIYGYDGVGTASSVNWRLDDLRIAVTGSTSLTNTPPVIAPLAPQSARVGQRLSFTLIVTPTDNDPIIYTNVTNTSGANGAYALEALTFNYDPSEADLGTHTFIFTAADQDGTNQITAIVNVLRRQTAAITMSLAINSYTQNFNQLATTDDSNEWDNAAAPLPAWYAYTALEQTSYRTGNGSGNKGGLYAFGPTDSSNRALGSLAANGNTYYYGVALTNATDMAITNITISFVAAQWRVACSNFQTLACEYCITNRIIPLTMGAWRKINALSFTTPITLGEAYPTVGAVYAAEPRLASITSYPLLPNDVLLIRWSDPDDDYNDHAFSIDDLNVVWNTGVLPDAIAIPPTGTSENFNEMGAGATEILPYLWRLETRDDAPRTTGAYATAARQTLCANLTTNFTTAGSYNFSATALGDQAVGGLSSASAAKSVSLIGLFRNMTGRTCRAFNVAFSVEKYRRGTTGTAVQLLASTNGVNWSVVGTAAAFSADENNAGYEPYELPGAVMLVNRQVMFEMPLPDNTLFYLAWQISATTDTLTANTQALGVDDIEITPITPSGTSYYLR